MGLLPFGRAFGFCLAKGVRPQSGIVRLAYDELAAALDVDALGQAAAVCAHCAAADAVDGSGLLRCGSCGDACEDQDVVEHVGVGGYVRIGQELPSATSVIAPPDAERRGGELRSEAEVVEFIARLREGEGGG